MATRKMPANNSSHVGHFFSQSFPSRFFLSSIYKVLNRHCLWPLRKILGVTNVLKSFYSSDSLELCGCSANKWVQLTERLMVSLALERMAGHWGPGGLWGGRGIEVDLKQTISVNF